MDHSYFLLPGKGRDFRRQFFESSVDRVLFVCLFFFPPRLFRRRSIRPPLSPLLPVLDDHFLLERYFDSDRSFRGWRWRGYGRLRNWRKGR